MEEKTIRILADEAKEKKQENREIHYILDCCTDVGICRKLNQDAGCARIFKTPFHTIVLAAVCDGAGGMEEGEYASKSTIQALNNWFDYRLNKLVLEKNGQELFLAACGELKQLIWQQNHNIFEYGGQKKIRIGTTLTAMLIIDEDYFIAQVGDSRAYLVKKGITQLTEDQSLVAREVREGRLTEEEARFDKRRNIILQCIGAAEDLSPDYLSGKVERRASYFLCSDGFVHQLDKEEMEAFMNPDCMGTIDQMHYRLLKSIETIKARGEKDNITVAAVRTW